MLPNLCPSAMVALPLLCLVVLIILMTTTFLFTSGGVLSQQAGAAWAALLHILRRMMTAARRRPGQLSTTFEVTDHAAVHRMLVQHSAAFRERPAHATPSTILSRSLHCNIFSAAHGSAFWRAARRNLVTGVLHPSRVHLFQETRARALAGLVQRLRSGAPAGESLHSPVYRIVAAMCFGEEVVADRLGEAGVRSMHKLQRDMLRALPGFKAVMRYPPMIGKLLHPSRWAQLLAFRRRQEETFLPLVAEVRRRRRKKEEEEEAASSCTSYVESLLDLRGDDDMVTVTEGQLVSLISEFLGNASDSTGAALEWTMANLVKHPRVQDKLRAEVNSVVAAAGGNNRSSSDGFIDEADLPRMPYLRAVVMESLRRHPPVPLVMRHVKGHEAARALGVPGGRSGVDATVNFLVGSLSREPAVWSDPMAFLPERFMPGGEAERVSLTCTTEVRMMPFGAGRRMCPGMKLAMLHLHYFVANLVREFQWLELEPDDDGHHNNAVDFAESRAFPFTTMQKPLRAILVPL